MPARFALLVTKFENESFHFLTGEPVGVITAHKVDSDLIALRHHKTIYALAQKGGSQLFNVSDVVKFLEENDMDLVKELILNDWNRHNSLEQAFNNLGLGDNGEDKLGKLDINADSELSSNPGGGFSTPTKTTSTDSGRGSLVLSPDTTHYKREDRLVATMDRIRSHASYAKLLKLCRRANMDPEFVFRKLLMLESESINITQLDSFQKVTATVDGVNLQRVNHITVKQLRDLSVSVGQE